MSRKRIIFLTAFAVIIVACVCVAVFNHNISVAYHDWRMEAAYGSLFGNPQPIGNGLAAFEVTAKDVDAAFSAYESHREALVDLGTLAHVQTSFPTLASSKTEGHHDQRSAFVNRMWQVFPNHRHYCLGSNGTFEAWVPVADEQRWELFRDRETKALDDQAD